MGVCDVRTVRLTFVYLVSLKFLFAFVNQWFSFSLAVVCSFLPIATMPKQNPHRVYLVSILTNGKLTPETCPAFSIKTVAFSLVSKD